MMPEDGTWPDWDRSKDTALWDMYARKHLEPGWAGELTPAQVDYIHDVLQGKRPRPSGVKRNLGNT